MFNQKYFSTKKCCVGDNVSELKTSDDFSGSREESIVNFRKREVNCFVKAPHHTEPLKIISNVCSRECNIAAIRLSLAIILFTKYLSK